MANKRSARTHASWREVHQASASWILGSLLLFFLGYVILFGPETLPPYKQQLVGIFCAILGGLFTYFFVGSVGLSKVGLKTPLLSIDGRAAGGVAVFVIILYWWNTSEAPILPEEAAEPAAEATSPISAPPQRESTQSIPQKPGSQIVGSSSGTSGTGSSSAAASTDGPVMKSGQPEPGPLLPRSSVGESAIGVSGNSARAPLAFQRQSDWIRKTGDYQIWISFAALPLRACVRPPFARGNWENSHPLTEVQCVEDGVLFDAKRLLDRGILDLERTYCFVLQDAAGARVPTGTLSNWIGAPAVTHFENRDAIGFRIDQWGVELTHGNDNGYPGPHCQL